MMENPNLIRRPIVVKGSRSSSASTRIATQEGALTSESASARRAGTTRPARARGTASSIRPRAAARKGFDELVVLRRALQHGRSELDVLRPAAGRRVPRHGPSARRPGFEFSVKLYQKFTHPRMFKERLRAQPAGGRPRDVGDLLDALARPTDADLDEFRRGIEPLALAASSARCSRSFRRASRTRRRRATTSPSCCAPSAATRSPSSCVIAAGAIASATRSRS